MVKKIGKFVPWMENDNKENYPDIMIFIQR